WKKPTREIFHLACRLLNVKPSETVYVGDDPKNDIEGAKMAGLKAVQKVVEGKVVSNLADAVIYRLSELPRVIDKLKQ
ncbi:MAG TPA: HAD family hydrolase, partial [Desulfurococcales archaeon]|nr:HAD family hydrolase [Desulfurococcales archaeon]